MNADAVPVVPPVVGACVNQAYFTKWLSEDELNNRLVIKNLDVAPFVGDFIHDDVPRAILFFTRCRHFIRHNDLNEAAAEALAMAEMFITHTDQARFLVQEQARAAFIATITAFIRNQEARTEIYPEFRTVQHLLDMLVADAPQREHDNILQLGANNATLADISRGAYFDGEHALARCIALLRRMSRAVYPVARSVAVQLLVNSTVSMVKQGNVTNQVIQKVTRDISRELNIEIEINSETILLFSKHFTGGITHLTAQNIFDRWEQWTPAVALRIRLLFQQALHSSMTAFQTIGMCIRKFPQFPWPRARMMIASDFAHFEEAVVAVGGNGYYGFNPDLGPAKSTRFKSLAWLCKEILIRYAGKETLARYQGWTRRPQHQDALRELIEEFQVILDAEAQADPNPQVMDHLNALLALQQNQAIFAEAAE
uniref:Putative nucleoprotein n=1 Tax=Soybean thrips chu-like virus 2 TaxID=2800864 RepID=A0A7T8G227_9VIRU|nr:putative nucleoprotein [Soybean thrips chu-like virus 2]